MQGEIDIVMKDMRSKERGKMTLISYVVRQCAYSMGEDRVKEFHYNKIK